jgi:hypothetical protein
MIILRFKPRAHTHQHFIKKKKFIRGSKEKKISSKEKKIIQRKKISSKEKKIIQRKKNHSKKKKFIINHQSTIKKNIHGSKYTPKSMNSYKK